MTTTPRKKYVTLATAAEMLDCSPRTLRRRISSGDLPAHRFVGKGTRRAYRVAEDDVLALLRPVPTA